MQKRTIERYSKRTILFHWVHVIAFVILVITGATMFLPGIGPSGGYSTGIIHRIAAVAFITPPVIYAIYKPRNMLLFCREMFTWKTNDLKWFRLLFRRKRRQHASTRQDKHRAEDVATGYLWNRDYIPDHRDGNVVVQNSHGSSNIPMDSIYSRHRIHHCICDVSCTFCIWAYFILE